MLTLVLTRHGLTARSSPEQHLGQRIDIGLTNEGRAQAEALGRRLAGIRFDRIVTSPLRRARQTAELIAGSAALAAGVESEPRLEEMDYGRWEGLTYEQIREHDAALRDAWEADPATIACPDGESGDDVAERCRAFLGDLIESHGGDPGADRLVLAVGHSTTNRILICVALDIPLAEYRARIVQSQVNLTALRWSAGATPHEAQLLLLNDVAHARRPSEPPWDD